MGDVHMRAQRPADAARAYRHALALAPSAPGIQQKISNADARLAKINARAKAKVTLKADAKAAPKPQPTESMAKAQPSAPMANASPLSGATAPAAAKHFSNAESETQSH